MLLPANCGLLLAQRGRQRLEGAGVIGDIVPGAFAQEVRELACLRTVAPEQDNSAIEIV